MGKEPIKHMPPAGTPYSLYTHCGVYEARIGDTYYLADDPLDDRQGNPPPGWGNPFQEGTTTPGAGRRGVSQTDSVTLSVSTPVPTPLRSCVSAHRAEVDGQARSPRVSAALQVA